MGNLEGASFAETPTWAVATVVTVLVSIGFLIHGSLKKSGKWLHRTKREPLYAALEKIKEELMVFGLLSLLMSHWIIYVAKICVKSSAVSSHFYPCSPPRNKTESAITRFGLTGSSHSNFSTSRLLLSSRHEDFCPEGLQSFASKESLEQLHRFLLVLGVSHVSYSFFAIALAMIKIYSWRTWENYAKSMALQRLEGSEEAVPNNTRMGRLSTFTFHHTAHPWSQHRALVWLLCFSRQFWSSINEADYMALRLGFITTHQLPLTYDFHKYMLRSMEEEFRDIVGISVPLWIFVIVCVFLSFHGTNIYFWISFFPAILILLVGTKLHHVVVKLAVEIMDSSPLEGFHQFNLRDELFWFGKPRFLLRIIQFISFQNAFEMATYIWSLATMICIDNSEWMRNGDYSPNRFQALADAVNLICGAKTQSNPENTVGILTMAGKGVRVLVTPTSDLGKILACMHGLEIGGEMNLAAGIQVAQLALKHRQNKKQQQRIIVFAGSPVKYDKKVLEMIGRKLKKNSVALDVVNFGEDDEGKAEKLEALVAAVNNNESSHIIHIPPGPNALSDVLISTPIFTGDGEGGSGFAAAAAAAAAGGVSGYDFGVDPNLDPELALALRVSMEEERARQEAAAKKAAEEAGNQEKGENQSTSQDVAMAENVNAGTSEPESKAIDLMEDENALLQQALAMSMDDSSSNVATRDTDMSEAASEDQDLALALQLSVQDSTNDQSNQTDMSKLLADQSFVSSILASLPGVDPNDPSVKDLLASMQGQSEKKDEDNDKEQKEDKK